ncbi:MAG: CHAP domain-containing protein [Eubacteriales bacterium]|nr:CHAP domain-containing protein [Eubacteriales bacterium]
MLDIKLKEENKGIKAIDKAATLSERMKSGVIKTKEKAENGYYQDTTHDTPEEYATDDATKKAEIAVRDTVYYTKRTVKKGTQKAVDKFRQNRVKKYNTKPESTELSVHPSSNSTGRSTSQSPRLKAPAEKSIKTTSKAVKKTGKGTIKTAQKSVKTAEKASKTAIKTTQQAAKAAQKTAETSVKATQRAAQAARATAKTAVATAKAAAKAIAKAIKSIIAGTKALVAAIAAGGWIAVVIIVVICLIALIFGSCFGIFFSSEDSGTGQTIQTAVQEINTQYQAKLNETKVAYTYDVLEMSESRAVWKEVLAVYAVKTTTDSDNPKEVATVDDGKKEQFKRIFWDMNEISSQTQFKTETVIDTADDGHGNIVETEKIVTRTYLYITISHKTAEQMADKYGFNSDQRKQLSELLSDENNSMWSTVLYGISGSDGQLVTTALSQVGNTGGQPYWSWYGFSSRVEWCACFLSWCANECGYIDTGIIPKFAACASQGVPWFKERGEWRDNSYIPSSGDIIFFDWESDGEADHVGIVEKVENGMVYTIEGNSGDSCKENSYPLGYSKILGFGVPAY